MGRSLPWYMKNPEKMVSGGGYGGKSGHRDLAAGLQCAPGLLSGDLLRISAAIGYPAPASGGRDFFSGSNLGLDLYLLCRLSGRHPDRVSSGYAFRNVTLGENRGSLAAADIFHNLGLLGDTFPVCPVSFEKNFGNCKNFVCIWGKMGYNKVYENLEITSKAEKGNPWQKRAPRPNM